MTELGIALTSVCADEKTENICRKFREAGLLFAVCCRYQEREKERLLSEQWFAEVTRYSPHFVFLYPDASCSSQAKMKFIVVSWKREEIRNSPSYVWI